MRWRISFLLLLCMLAVPATADSLWDHNGSILRLRSEGAERFFEYLQPRTELRDAGVTAGTVLFEGKAAGESYSGTAFRFSKKCGAIGYVVEGSLSADSRTLTLSGRVPKRNPNCQVVGHRDDVLVFRAQGTAGHQPGSPISANDAVPRQPVKNLPSDRLEHKPTESDAPVATLPFAVMGCKSRNTFDQWVKTFRRANIGTEAEVVAQGLKTKDCAALSDGPVEIIQADESYLCVRPRGKAVCYWTLRAVFAPRQKSPG